MGICKRLQKDGKTISYEVNVSYKGQRSFGTAPSEKEAEDLLVTLKAELIAEAKRTEAKAVEVSKPLCAPSDTSWSVSKAREVAMEVRWAGTPSEYFYKRECDIIEGYFKPETKLNTITTTEVDKFRKWMADKGNLQSTINHKLAALSILFKIAIERTTESGVLVKPSLGMKKVNRGRVRFLSDDEELALLGMLKQQGKDDVHDWVVTLIDTGLRPIETRDLLPGWVDFKTGLLHVWKSKTPAGIRAVPMTKRVKAILERRCLRYKTTKLFPFSHDVLSNAWDSIRKDLKLNTDPNFVPYVLRHTFATRLVQRGEQIAILQKLLGHETPAMTMIYAHFGAEQYVSAIAKLEPKETTQK